LREEGYPVGEVWVAKKKRPEHEKENIENIVINDIPPILMRQLR